MPAVSETVALRTLAAQWLRIGTVGFGGPPAHISLLRTLCVQKRHWLSDEEFEDGIAATNLLPGPASTQLAIYCAWRLRGTVGAVLGGLCFILPGLIVILGLSIVLLSASPPRLVLGAAAGAGAAVAAVAVHAAAALIPAGWRRAGPARPGRARWVAYLTAGVVAAALVGAWVVVVLIAGGLCEAALRRPARPGRPPRPGRLRAVPVIAAPALAVGGLAALCWTALKVGALSYGGGFVIIPLMQSDAVHRYHWMSDAQFLYAVALGQITPGPVVHTVAVVGYAAAGVGGALLAATIAFAPSFLFVIVGARHFDTLRANATVQAFLIGAGACAIGAIGGSAISLALAIGHLWQWAVLALAAGWVLALRRGVVSALLGSAALGALAALAGFPVA
ncbi:MAG TPA: chromate efflux transporter [Actinoplanes sp.]|nr:chromate efflux transporter [Actinoplanes sp.]